MTKRPMNFTARTIRQIAVDADTDPRTVSRVIAGKRTWDSTRERIQAALRRFVNDPSLKGGVNPAAATTAKET